METDTPADDLCDFESGSLCLDFSNTAEWHASAHPLESLNTFADLVSWSRTRGLLSEEEASALVAEAARQPEDAARILTRAIELRETIYRIFSGIAHDEKPPLADLDGLNAMLSHAMARARVIPLNGGMFGWSWSREEPVLDKMLWPIARSAADLLTSDQIERVGQCADDRGCGWLFIDTSRNRSRQWCSMESCGNRAKAKRHYQRTKKHPLDTSA
jgi:predicted RNA-binding Zn ribbon-like protein